MAFTYSITRILEILGSESICEGSYEGSISGIASLKEACEGDLSFLGNKKYKKDVLECSASVVLLPQDYQGSPKAGQLWIRVKNPSFALAVFCRDIENSLTPLPEPGIHPTAVIESDAQISPQAYIGPFCYISSGAKIGAATLHSHVSVGVDAVIGDEVVIFQRVVISAFCNIGLRNRISAGAIIGSDGYGYEYHEGSHQRVPQIGCVETEADVDVGANTTIDRARFGVTFIGAGTKIDNQVQIGHNVQIGKHSLIVAQVGISGSTVLGDGVIVAGQAGLAGHLEIGDGAFIGGGCATTRSVGAGEKVGGSPMEPLSTAHRLAILKRRLPELFKRFDQLEKNVEFLEKRGND